MTLTTNYELEQAIQIVRESSYIVAFTGAGVSTESGIDDFRSPGGLWSRYDPGKYANYQVFLKEPKYYWELALELTPAVFQAQPNPAHLALVELEKMGKLKAIITQNIDTLHQRAGSKVPVLELHGTYDYCYCLDCGEKTPRLEIIERVRQGEKVPRCHCGGLIKSGAVLFGEPLPQEVVEQAYQHSAKCDCFIVIGSSLVVSPANYMPVLASRNGARLIFVNRDPTIMDDMASVILRGDAGENLHAIIEGLRS